MKADQLDQAVQDAIDRAWDPDSAMANMDEGIENLPLLASLFGASWYFTRLVFYRGPAIAYCFDGDMAEDSFTPDALHHFFSENDIEGDLEDRFDRLRLSKNEKMLQIFLGQLQGKLNEEQTETALTHLAEISLQFALNLSMAEADARLESPVILAMGRMAGYEMNYGSDLDLIFLYSDEETDVSQLTRRIQLLLRHIATPTACGLLYEIDMRLRPHGTSGTLISPARYFIEYHTEERAIWERQMMTRCRPIADHHELGSEALSQVMPYIYGNYEDARLRTEIVRMRNKVEEELGNPRGKFEVKRGKGGIMDIDFMTHYLQLLHAHDHPELRSASTRQAIRRLQSTGYLSGEALDELLPCYDFLKRVEGALRVADLKSISAFSQNPADVTRLARAMGYIDGQPEENAKRFLDHYQQTTEAVRTLFNSLMQTGQ